MSLALKIGLTQGVLAAALVNLDTPAPAVAAAVAAVIALAVVLGLGLQLAWPAERPTRLLTWLGLLAAILAGCAAWVAWDQPVGDAPDLGRSDRVFSLLLWGLGGTWCGISLAAAAGEAAPEPASRLHWLRGAMHQALACLAVVGVVYLVIAAGVALLDLVGLDLADLVYTAEGTAFLIPVAWGLGMHGLRRRGLLEAGQADRAPLLDRAIRLDSRLARALLPVMAVLVGIFLVGLLVQGLTPLWNTRAATAILLGMQGLVVVAAMLAAPAAPDDDAAPVPALLRHSADALLLTLPVLAALSAHALWLRVNQYGLTPERVHAAALCLLAVVAALGLAGVVLQGRLRRRPWLEGAPLVAWAVAGTLLAMAILFHTPWLDPLTLSARSQYARLVAGRVDPDTYRFDALWWELGTAGRAAAEQFQAELPTLQERDVYSDAQVAALHRKLEETMQRGGALRHQPEVAATDITVIPDSATAPHELLEAVAASARFRPAREGAVLAITPLHADDDGEAEWLLIPSEDYWPALLFDRQANGTWEHVGEYPVSMPRASLLEALARDTVHTQAPAYRDLLLNGRRVPLNSH